MQLLLQAGKAWAPEGNKGGEAEMQKEKRREEEARGRG